MLNFDSEIYGVEEIPAPKSIWQRICEGARNFGVWFCDWGLLLFIVPLGLLTVIFAFFYSFAKGDSGPFTVIDNGHTYTNLSYKAGYYYDSSNTYRFSDRAIVIKLTK